VEYAADFASARGLLKLNILRFFDWMTCYHLDVDPSASGISYRLALGPTRVSQGKIPSSSRMPRLVLRLFFYAVVTQISSHEIEK